MRKILVILFVIFSGFTLAKININTATVDELVLLKGIGPVKATSIINYRKQNGKFKTLNDLISVKGINERLVKKLADKITVNEPTDLTDI